MTTKRMSAVAEPETEGEPKESPLLDEPRYRVIIDLGVATSEAAAEQLLSHFSGMRFWHGDDNNGEAKLGAGEFVLRREQLSVERAG